MPLPIFSGTVKAKATAKKGRGYSSGSDDYRKKSASPPPKALGPTTSAAAPGSVLPPGSVTLDLADFSANYQDAGGMFGPPVTANSTPVYGAKVQGYTPAPWTPNLLDPRALQAIYDRNPVRPQQAVGGNVDDRIRTQALARKAALEEKLKSLDAGYDQASEQIHGGYQAVAQLLAQAQGGYTQGMAGVTSAQGQANAGIQQSGLLQSDAVANILASQGVGGVGAGQAAAVAASAQAGANAVGTTAAGGLATGQSTLNTFFSGLPALAAMGEAGGVARAELMRTLSKGRATSDSSEAGLAAESALRDKDLDYRRQLASDDVRSTRDRDNAMIADLTRVVTGNNDIKNSAGQYNSGQVTSARSSLAGDGNREAARVASDRTGVASAVEASRVAGERDLRQQKIQWAQWKTDNDIATAKALAQAQESGVSRAGTDKFIKSGEFVTNKVNSFVDRGASRFFAPPIPDKINAGKPDKIVDGFIRSDGTVNADKYSEWEKATGGNTDDLLVWLAYQLQNPDPAKKMTYQQTMGYIRDVSRSIAATQNESITGGTDSQSFSTGVSAQAALEKALKADFNVMTGMNEDRTQYVDKNTGSVVTLTPLLPALINGSSGLTPGSMYAPGDHASNYAPGDYAPRSLDPAVERKEEDKAAMEKAISDQTAKLAELRAEQERQLNFWQPVTGYPAKKKPAKKKPAKKP